MSQSSGTAAVADPRPALGRKLRSAGKWLAVGTAVGGIASLGASAAVTRLLEPSDAAVFFLFFSLAHLMALIVQAGPSTAGSRFIPDAIVHHDTARAGGLVLTIFAIVIAGGGLLATAFVFPVGPRVLGFFIDDASLIHSSTLLLGALFGLSLSLRLCSGNIFRSLHEFHKSSFLSQFGFVPIITASLIFLMFNNADPTLDDVLLVFVLGNMLGAVTGLTLVWRRLRKLGVSWPANLGSFLPAAASMALTAILMWGLSQAATFIVAATLTDEELALYAAAVRLLIFIEAPVQLLANTLSPIISDLYARNQTSTLQLCVRTVSFIAMFPFFFLAFCFWLYGDILMSIMFGEAYAAGGDILAVLLTGQFMMLSLGFSINVLQMTGNQKVVNMIMMLSFIVSMALTTLLATTYGLMGVCWGVALGGILGRSLMAIAVYRRTGLLTLAWPYLQGFKLLTAR